MTVLRVTLEIVSQILELISRFFDREKQRVAQNDKVKAKAYDKLDKAVSARRRARSDLRANGRLSNRRYQRNK